MLLEYWNFIDRDLLDDGATRGIDAIPQFYYKTVVWSLIFSMLHLIVPLLVRWLFPAWHKGLSEQDRNDYSSYLVCLAHHFYVVPTAWMHIYQDWQLTAQQASLLDYCPVTASIAPFCIGYLIGDTLVFALPEMFRFRFEYIVHHVLILWLVLTAVFGPGQLCRFVPHLLLCDTTNVFFNTAWVLRRCGCKESAVVTALEALFAASFLITRVVNLPAVFLSVALKPFAAALGWARFTFAPISLLQWYWFYRIAATVMKRMRKAASNSSSNSGRSSNSSNGNNDLQATAAVGENEPSSNARRMKRQV